MIEARLFDTEGRLFRTIAIRHPLPEIRVPVMMGPAPNWSPLLDDDFVSVPVQRARVFKAVRFGCRGTRIRWTVWVECPEGQAEPSRAVIRYMEAIASMRLESVAFFGTGLPVSPEKPLLPWDERKAEIERRRNNVLAEVNPRLPIYKPR